MKKWFLLFAIALGLIYAGIGKRGESHSQDSINGYGPAMVGEPATVEEPAMARTVNCHLCHGNCTCYHCNGDGFRNGRRCSVCSGTGSCDACEGTGFLEVLEIDGMDCTVCAACHGSGDCGVCDGTGRIVHQFSSLGRIDNDCSLCHGSGNCLSCKGTGLCGLAGF